MILVNPKHWIALNGTWDTQTEFITSQGTLDARDFSSAVSGFCQVFIVARAKFFFSRLRRRGFGLRPKMCRPSANTENSRRTREKPLVPRVKSRRPTSLNLMTLVSSSNTIIVKLNQEHPHRFYKRIHYFKTESVGFELLDGIKFKSAFLKSIMGSEVSAKMRPSTSSKNLVRMKCLWNG